MKNIFLSIAFLDHAYNAALYAAELAKHTGARLIIFHSYSPVIQTADEELGEELQNLERKAQEKLDNLASKLRSLHPISITRLLKPGNVVEETLHVAHKTKTDLLIIGVAETTYLNFPVLNALTSELLAKTSLPLLLIPPKAIFRLFEKAFVSFGETDATHSISDLRFLNKFFQKFREVQFFTSIQLKSATSVYELVNPVNQDYTPAVQTQIELSKEYKQADQPILNQQVQVLVKSYSSTAKLEIDSNFIFISEAVPVLLLPARI